MPTINALPENVLQVRAPGLNFYVLRDESGLYLLDAGFIGGRRLLKAALRRRGWSHEPIRGVIVTHGHLDHILNVQAVARDTGAWIAAPRLDAAHYLGRPLYHSWSRVTGWLEAVGRPMLGFRPFTPDRWLDDGDTIDVWHGLTAIHLPGHTVGHMGFYCRHRKLLFSADLFASYGHLTHFPPRIFNSQPELIRTSVSNALKLDLIGILPNHCDRASPRIHLQRPRDLDSR